MNYKNIDEERHFQSTLQLIHENRTSLALQISQLKERINQLGRLPDSTRQPLINPTVAESITMTCMNSPTKPYT